VPLKSYLQVSIAFVLSKVNRTEEALLNLEEALPILRITCGEKGVSVASTLFQIGDIYERKGKFEAALKLFEKSLRYTRRVAGDEALNLRTYTQRIIGLYNKLCRFDDALEMLKKDEIFMRHILPNYDSLVNQMTFIRQIQTLEV
jgi:tetratricopeptide (TPR) repeat protein